MTYGARHVFENMEVSIAKSMMEECFRPLKGRGRTPDNVNYGDIFAVSSSYAVESGKLSDTWKQLYRWIWGRLTKCCYKSTQPLHSSVTISRICGIQFITFRQCLISWFNVQLPTQANPSTSSMKSNGLEKELGVFGSQPKSVRSGR